MEEYLKLNVGKGNRIILRTPEIEEEVNLYFIGKCKELEKCFEGIDKQYIEKSDLWYQKMNILEFSSLIKDDNVRHYFEKSVNNWFDDFIKNN